MSWYFPKTKVYGHAQRLTKGKSISLKKQLQCHVVMLLPAYSESINHLPDNLYLAFSLRDHAIHWLEERYGRNLFMRELTSELTHFFILPMSVASNEATAQGARQDVASYNYQH